MARATTRRSSGTADLYDRVAHNLYSINMVWVLMAGFLVMFMQAGFAWWRRLCRAKNAAHTCHELHGLPAWLLRVLGVRVRDRLGQLVQRAGCAGLVLVAGPRHCRAQQRLGLGAATDASGAPPACSRTA